MGLLDTGLRYLCTNDRVLTAGILDIPNSLASYLTFEMSTPFTVRPSHPTLPYPMTAVTWFGQANVLLVGVAVGLLPLSQEQVWTIEGSMPPSIT